MSHSFRPKLKTLLVKALRGLCRVYFRPGWIEHGHGGASLPAGIYVANYGSWIDPLLLMLLLDKEFADSEPDFAVAINIRHQNRWWARLADWLGNVLLFDPTRSDAECNKFLADAIHGGRTVIVQPEGRPTDTNALLPACDTLAGLLAEGDPLLHPLFIEGTACTVFSNVRPRQSRTRLWPRITLHTYAPRRLTLPAASKGRERTKQAADQLYDLLSDAAFAQYDYHCTLFRGILRAMHRHGGAHIIAEDMERGRISYRKLVTGSYVLGGALVKHLHENEQTVGFMLPNANGVLVAFCGLQAFGRIPAMLNFTAGRRNICLAAQTASIRTVITSKRFVKLAELEQVINALREQGQKVLYLEDMRKEIGLLAKLSGLWRGLRGFDGYEKLHRDSTLAFECERPAVILFTSGSEGAPKGVALSHENLMANISQLQARIDFGIRDCIFNPLPMFHTSGLTGGVVLPLMSGMKMFLYPSPLHYQIIPELIADAQATILFATDTFLNGYARYGHPYHLHRLRYVFAGAEKLREETRRQWAERFGVRVFEGYGVTETAPVLCFNTPMHNKPGTVGRFAPDIRHRLEPVEGIQQGGRLLVQAPNVMLGYLTAENPDNLATPADGWYDTGDIVEVDAEGFVHILGRARRFAKIGGEMVSLAGVEQHLARLWPDADHAILTRPDARKGEQLVLVTTHTDADRQSINTYYREQGIPELQLPRSIHHIDSLPVLGTGKIDYPALGQWLEQQAPE
jgi:acyl-[acyl-carrier-protein]-phospholipid O-acyltransferase / long-chain-fatty-acid--[acyl-carrier-protein] ligase